MSIETLKTHIDFIKNNTEIGEPYILISDLEKHLEISPVEWLAQQICGDKWNQESNPWYFEIQEALAMERSKFL